jgi:hypothetical protein
MRRIRRALGLIFVTATLGLAAGAFIERSVLAALLFGLIGTRSIWRRRAIAARHAYDRTSGQSRRAA